MTKRKVQTLKELYGITEEIKVPKITPVLKGNCRIQGPIEDSEDFKETNTESPRAKKKLRRRSVSEKVHMIEESGICNVCATPCSSCIHSSSASTMEIKGGNNFSDETSKGKVLSRSSIISDPAIPVKSRSCKDQHYTASETSNLLNTSSTHDSFSENAESKAILVTFDTSGASEDLEIRSKVSRVETVANEQSAIVSSSSHVTSDVAKQTISNQQDEQKSTECHGDDISSFAGDCNATNPGGDLTEDREKINTNSRIEAGVDIDHGHMKPEPVKCSDLNEEIERSNTLHDVSDNEKSSVQSVPADENDELDVLEDDVKVCDICGDAGREDLLAFCSRCTDGAEHTYCMQIMLNKVPERDWLCEECKLKEDARIPKQEIVKKVLASLIIPSLNEKILNSGSADSSKILPKLDTRPDAESSRGTAVPHFSPKRYLENAEVTSAAKRQSLETNLRQPNPLLIKETSVKSLDMGKVTPVHPIPSPRGHSGNNYQDIANSATTSVHNSSKFQQRHQIPRGISYLKSNSFNKPKVKLVEEDVPPKNKLANSKSMLIRSGSSLSNSTESKAKIGSSNFSRSEGTRGLKTGENKLTERMHSFKSDRSLASPRPSSGGYNPKAEAKVAPRVETMSLVSSATNSDDLKTVQQDGKMCPSKTKNLVANIVSETPNALAGRRDFKRPSSLFSRRGKSPSLVGNCNSFESRKSQVSLKDEATVNLCSVGNLREVISSSKLTDSVAILPPKRSGICDERAATSDDIIPSAGNLLKSSIIDLKSPMKYPQNLDDQVVLPIRQLPVPQLDYIWQGGFEVHRNGGLMDFRDGIQAHLSTCASPKVLEVVNKLSPKLLLEEVPRLSTWPTQFENCATENNIGLYFFAKDVESFTKYYTSMLDSMIKNDLALKGNFGGIELLIFPSNQLPEKSQCWNRLFFLWGVFRGKRTSCMENVLRSPKKPSLANLNLMPSEHELTSPVMDCYQKECSSRCIEKELSLRNISQSESEAVKSVASTYLLPFSSSGIVGTTYRELPPPDQNGLSSESNSSQGKSALDTGSSSITPQIDEQILTVMKGKDAAMDEYVKPGSKTVLEHELCSEVSTQKNVIAELKTVSTVFKSSSFGESGLRSPSLDKHETSSGSSKVSLAPSVEERVQIDLEADPLSSSRKSPFVDFLETVSVSCSEISANTGQDAIMGGANNDYKKMKRSQSDIIDRSSYREKFRFPFDLHLLKECGQGSNSIPVQVISSDDEDEIDLKIPNLNLALGAEKVSLKKGGVLPLFSERLQKTENKERTHDDPVSIRNDDLLASLSLSLAGPSSSDKEELVPKSDHVLPEGRDLNTSIFLFGEQLGSTGKYCKK
ncbi:hypothetical protein GIB67_040593 [Kingdonia uniflora]|uniref:PHD-type domain-containing protein n=1 Tax=Kingdonia uniflora TaxID=39325 RepID=A0A7J7M957_9MAGN|nr:hypothetical protein GIB67_040593 [Kingdonia uniflora]